MSDAKMTTWWLIEFDPKFYAIRDHMEIPNESLCPQEARGQFKCYVIDIGSNPVCSLVQPDTNNRMCYQLHAWKNMQKRMRWVKCHSGGLWNKTRESRWSLHLRYEYLTYYFLIFKECFRGASCINMDWVNQHWVRVWIRNRVHVKHWHLFTYLDLKLSGCSAKPVVIIWVVHG